MTPKANTAPRPTFRRHLTARPVPLQPRPVTGHLCIAGGVTEGTAADCPTCQAGRVLEALATLTDALPRLGSGVPVHPAVRLRAEDILPRLTVFAKSR